MLNTKLPRPRGFEYQYRYYTPSEEEERRIQFRRIRKSKIGPRSSTTRLIVLLIALILAFVFLQRKAGSLGSSQNIEQIQVEDVIVVD